MIVKCIGKKFMKTSYKIALFILMAATIVVAIIDIKLSLYQEAFYMVIQLFWLGIFYSAFYGWSKTQTLNQKIMKEWDKTTQALLESTKREEIAHELIADLRKRIEK